MILASISIAKIIHEKKVIPNQPLERKKPSQAI